MGKIVEHSYIALIGFTLASLAIIIVPGRACSSLLQGHRLGRTVAVLTVVGNALEYWFFPHW